MKNILVHWISCEGYYCETRLWLQIYSDELGQLPGPLYQQQLYYRMLPGDAWSLKTLVSPAGPVMSTQPQQYVLAVQDEYGMNANTNLTLQVKAVQQGTSHYLTLVGQTQVTAVNGVAFFNNLRPAHTSLPYQLIFFVRECDESCQASCLDCVQGNSTAVSVTHCLTRCLAPVCLNCSVLLSVVFFV